MVGNTYSTGIVVYIMKNTCTDSEEDARAGNRRFGIQGWARRRVDAYGQYSGTRDAEHVHE